jgi:hypothetical protein
MLPRSRTARFAALALALTTPLVAATAGTAFAAGESASAVLTSPTSDSATTFTWNYTFDKPAEGGNDFSNLAIGFCSADILADVESVEVTSGTVDTFPTGDVQGGHDGFGPGIKIHMPEDTGTITITFGSAYPVVDGGLKVQSHSGAGLDGITWADGPGPCLTDDGDDDGDDDGVGDDGDDGVGDDDGNGNVDTAGGGTGTDVLGVTFENGDDSPGGTQVTTSPADSTVTPVVQPTTVPTANPSSPAVIGNELPRTGTHVQFLVTLAFSLVLAGLALRAAVSRRIRSASFPG